MEPIANEPVRERDAPGNVRALLPQEIDLLIAEEISALTQTDNNFWSSPDHDRKEYLHCFFQYPAMMVPVVQKKLIEIIINCKPGISNVLDPYMGSGTSLVACMENGLDCFGQDINPLAVLVTRTRTGPFYVKAIEERKSDLFNSIENDQSENIEANFTGLHKWFKHSTAVELSKIVRAIRKEKRPAIRRFYWVILAEVVRINSNDRTSTYKLHTRPADEIQKRSLSSINLFKEHFESCLKDLLWYSNLLTNANKLSKGAYLGEVSLRLLDSKTKVYTPNNQSNYFDLLVTSPPYGDNKTTVTYGQHSYLPLQWIDLSDIHELATSDFLRTTSEIDSRGLGGKLQTLDEKQLQELFRCSPSFYATYRSLESKSPDKLKKVVSFIYDLSLSIQNIHDSLKLDSYQIWTVGNRNVGGIEIPNDRIIEELIVSKGAIVVTRIEREILNKRMAYRNKDAELMSYEDILIFRKIGN
ncbi:site-specific DNA-methyltransferase [Flaviaesturariibacter aridisoli]|uniref:site-specific DNA-methyltransferase (cytosine-N(4)-specific) n=1 Tax=Flaviaesturariibacter aridisoli TaxID=2545761 RepID=A0A4R4E3Q2_9BACT|nr:site-specific DNA-methyltransferase [Flaviaesturariibacter aridisoli]TCZ73463.1 site-specific DNA-methyltransferase [Flaviaesturariibacter aridisoli]